MGIIRGAKHTAEAWKFMKWYCTDPAGTKMVYDLWGDLPGYRHSPVFDTRKTDPIMNISYVILDQARLWRPVTIVTDELMIKILNGYVGSAIVMRGESPFAVLENANKQINASLAKALKTLEGTK